MKTVLITGSSGLIGSEAVAFFDERDWRVVGVDNNMRQEFFGPDGDTTWVLERLMRSTRRFAHNDLDIRDRAGIDRLVKESRPDLIIHCAAQPSHDLAAQRPFEDFEVNAGGTLNLLEATRRHSAESPFIFMSTNKVYGDAPNELALVELETRYDYADPGDRNGISEDCRIDGCLHSLFGASKLAADILVQEYGRYFDMPTVCLRGGCLTGANHSGAELHGFLAYLAKAVAEGREYRIFGYKGKQVRDNIHSFDVCTAMLAFHQNPRSGAVYNLGGGRENSISVLEAIDRFEELLGRRLATRYVEEPRRGDHVCYISDLGRIRVELPDWQIRRPLATILQELAAAHAVAAGR